MAKRKNDLCTRQISFRCTEKQKKMIKKLSEEREIGQKDFILKCIHDSIAEEKQSAKKEINHAACACIVQELLNYLGKNQKEDSHIEEVCKTLWDLVN